MASLYPLPVQSPPYDCTEYSVANSLLNVTLSKCRDDDIYVVGTLKFDIGHFSAYENVEIIFPFNKKYTMEIRSKKLTETFKYGMSYRLVDTIDPIDSDDSKDDCTY